jgi:hypothetical protein
MLIVSELGWMRDVLNNYDSINMNISVTIIMLIVSEVGMDENILDDHDLFIPTGLLPEMSQVTLFFYIAR